MLLAVFSLSFAVSSGAHFDIFIHICIIFFFFFLKHCIFVSLLGMKTGSLPPLKSFDYLPHISYIQCDVELNEAIVHDGTIIIDGNVSCLSRHMSGFWYNCPFKAWQRIHNCQPLETYASGECVKNNNHTDTNNTEEEKKNPQRKSKEKKEKKNKQNEHKSSNK